MSIKIRTSILLVFVALFPNSVQAHHSGAMFDHSKTMALTGTVRLFQWTNPHCYIQLLVKNDKGVEEEWSVEMASPMHLMGQGWGKRTIKSGDQISVTIHPLRNGDKGGEIDTAKTADGKPIGKAGKLIDRPQDKTA
jgi:hypothetical protein